MRMLLCILCILGLVVFVGCNLGGPPDPPVNVISIEIDPGSIIPSCCGVNHSTFISGIAPLGGQYYVLALMSQDTLVTYGETVYIPEGTYQNIELQLFVSYLDEIPTGTMRMEVFALEDIENGINYRNRTIASAAMGMVEVANYSDSICLSCCTNETTVDSAGNRGLRRYKALAIRRVTEATEIRARIQTKYGRLCGADTPTADSVAAQQNCFATMTEFIDPSLGQPRQVQIGWINIRDTLGVTDTAIYVEISLTPELHLFYKFKAQHNISVPADSSFHDYEIVKLDDT